jgi:hypothetical protein
MVGFCWACYIEKLVFVVVARFQRSDLLLGCVSLLSLPNFAVKSAEGAEGFFLRVPANGQFVALDTGMAAVESIQIALDGER